MAATKKDVDRWVEEGKAQGATHIVSMCDTFDWDDYPIFVMPGQDPERIRRANHGNNMQKCNEIIDLSCR